MYSAPMKWISIGLSSAIIGILSLIWTPYELAMEERLRMRPGLPAFDWWYKPPDVQRINFYIFNITNADEYLSGIDRKLKLQEVGPLVFRDVLEHRDPVHNENSTLSFTLLRNAIWDPSLNPTINLNDTIIYPNVPVLMTASIFWDSNYFMKVLLNSLFELTKSKPIVKKTLYEIMFDNRDPFLEVAHASVPSVAVHKNVGLIPMLYPGYGHRMNVFIGTKFGHRKFFLTDKFNGSTHMPGLGSKCKDTIKYTSSNIIYSQMMRKNDTVVIFNHLMCRNLLLFYQEEAYRQGIKTYKFSTRKNAYDRIYPLEEDCYKGTPTLPNGLTDLTPCWYNYPIVGSYPHFLYSDPKVLERIDGLTPDPEKHLPYAFFEPTSGLILKAKGNMQVNLHIKPLENFHGIFDKFQDMIVPIFYLEMSHDYVPDYVINLIKFFLALPVTGTIFSSLFFLLALYSVWKLWKYFTNKHWVDQGKGLDEIKLKVMHLECDNVKISDERCDKLDKFVLDCNGDVQRERDASNCCYL